MAQKRHVLPLSLDDELIADINYACMTGSLKINEATKRKNFDISRAIEEILRLVIPSKSKSLSDENHIDESWH